MAGLFIEVWSYRPLYGGPATLPPPTWGGAEGRGGWIRGRGTQPPPMADERFFSWGVCAKEGVELGWESPALYKGAGRLVGMWWWGEARAGGRKT